MSVPPQIVAAMRPHLPEVVDDVVAAVALEVPVYQRPLEGAFGRAVRLGVTVALDRFLSLPGSDQPALDGSDREVYVQLGRGELLQGRSLEGLLAAYRVGARVSFRRFATLAREAGLDADALIPLAEATFAYIDELSAASAEGFAVEQSNQAGQRDRMRRELLALLLSGTADSAGVAQAATAAAWALPETVVAVAVPPGEDEGLSVRLGPTALVGEYGDSVIALLPAPSSASARTVLARALVGRPAAVGPSRPWADAAVSLRLALLALQLPGLGSDPLFVEDHLAALVLHRDPELVTELVARRLAPLQEVRETSRERLAETLLAWLAHRGERQRIADALHVHAQTVGYRLGQLRSLFGDALDDANARFELELALRASIGRPAS